MPNPSPSTTHRDALHVPRVYRSLICWLLLKTAWKFSLLKINLTLCFPHPHLTVCTEWWSVHRSLLKVLLALLFGTTPRAAEKHQLNALTQGPQGTIYSRPHTQLHPFHKEHFWKFVEICLVSSKSQVPSENLN